MKNWWIRIQISMRHQPNFCPNISSSNMAQNWEGFFLKSHLCQFFKHIFWKIFKFLKEFFPGKKGWNEKEFQKKTSEKDFALIRTQFCFSSKILFSTLLSLQQTRFIFNLIFQRRSVQQRKEKLIANTAMLYRKIGKGN